MAEKENLPFNRVSRTRLIKRAEKYNINTIITLKNTLASLKMLLMIIKGIKTTI